MAKATDDGSAALKIGAVARMTGVSVHTLRKWEDRYGAVQPQRTEGGERIYTRTDLKRLALIKRLSDAGMSLREIAALSLDELTQAWVQLSGAQDIALPGAVPDTVRIAILGDVLPALLERRMEPAARLQILAAADSVEGLARALAGEVPDVLVYECPRVQPQTRVRIDAMLKRFSPSGGLIVVYGFAARAQKAELRQPRVALTRAPVELEELEQICAGLMYGAARRQGGDQAERKPAPEIAPRRLSLPTIARIARSAPRMRCECPHHLADIVSGLMAFEDYSAECENRNAEDAALHHYLWVCAARARAIFESAIVRVAEAEGIRLDD